MAPWIGVCCVAVLINHTLNLGGAAIDRVGGMALIFALSHCPVHAEVPIGTGQRSGHCGGQRRFGFDSSRGIRAGFDLGWRGAKGGGLIGLDGFGLIYIGLICTCRSGIRRAWIALI